MGLINKTLANKAILEAENFDMYMGGAEKLAIQITATDVGEALAIATTDVDTTNHKIKKNTHGYVHGTKGQFTTTGTLPSNLALATDYYIFNPTASEFQVSLSEDGGSEQEVTSIITTAEGSLKEQTNITCVEDLLASARVQTITCIAEGSKKEIIQFDCVADVDDSLDKKYFILHSATGSIGFWYDVDDSGTQVDPALVALTDSQVEITTVTTGMTANEVAEATYDAIIAQAAFEAGTDPEGSTNIFTIQCAAYGSKDAPSAGNSGFTVTQSVVGTDSDLHEKGFYLADAAGTVFVWMDVLGGGSAPTNTGDRVIEVTTINEGDANTEVATKIAAALNADSEFSGSATDEVATITNADSAELADLIEDLNSGFTLAITNAGNDALSLDGKYFILHDEVGSVAFWYDVASGTSAPEHGADRAVEITTVAAGNSAIQVAAATYAAIVADSKFEAGEDYLNGVIMVQSTTYAAKGEATAGTSGFQLAQAQAGSEKLLDGKYFILEDAAGTVAFWFDMSDGTLEPDHGADRAVEVTTITSGMTAGALGDALYTAITNDSKFEAGSNDNAGNLLIKNTDVSPISEQSAGDSGFTVVESIDYSDHVYFTNVGVGAHTFTPESISGATVTAQKSCDGVNWVNIATATTIDQDKTVMIEEDVVAYTYLRIACAITAGFYKLKAVVTGWSKN